MFTANRSPFPNYACAVTRRRKLILAISAAALAVAAWIGYRAVYTLRHVPEAYAAWDTGTLLVEYLQTHDNHWPTSWDDLLTVLDLPREADIVLYGSSGGNAAYARSLRERIAVNWSLDPAQIADANPVTRPDGNAFTVLWEGGDPNEIVREYLRVDGRDR